MVRTILTIVAAAAVLMLDALTPLGLAVWLLQVVLVWVATLWASRQQIIAVASVCAIFIVLGFWWSPRTEAATWVDISNLLLALGTVVVLTQSCLRRMTIEEARRKAAQEVGQMLFILGGLLPMCAWCKKIRNESGHWEPLETYIGNLSPTEFTHRMCDKCAARFHP